MNSIAHRLQSVLRDPALPSAIADLSNQQISELSRDLQAALVVARDVIIVRTHQEAQP